jgi:hypothetical protein
MTIQDAFARFVRDRIPQLACIGTVTATDGQTCTVLPIAADTPIHGVRLRATIDNDSTQGLLITPRLGSYVALGYLDARAGEAFLLMYSEIETIEIKSEHMAVKVDLSTAKITLNATEININNGQNGGLACIQPLRAALNQLNQSILTIKTAIQSAPIVPSDGGAAFKAALIAATASIQPIDISTLEDTQVKH